MSGPEQRQHASLQADAPLPLQAKVPLRSRSSPRGETETAFLTVPHPEEIDGNVLWSTCYILARQNVA